MVGRAACGANDCAEVSAGATRLFEFTALCKLFLYGSRSRGGHCFTEAPPELQV